MKKPDKKILESLSSLESLPSWEEVLRWIDETIQELREESDSTKDEVMVRQSQGKRQILKSFVDFAKNARKYLKR